jgi:hypothetical protein
MKLFVYYVEANAKNLDKLCSFLLRWARQWRMHAQRRSKFSKSINCGGNNNAIYQKYPLLERTQSALKLRAEQKYLTETPRLKLDKLNQAVQILICRFKVMRIPTSTISSILIPTNGGSMVGVGTRTHPSKPRARPCTSKWNLASLF